MMQCWTERVFILYSHNTF